MMPPKWIIAAHIVAALGLVVLVIVSRVQCWELGPFPFLHVGAPILLLSAAYWFTRPPRRRSDKPGPKP
jgi:hypothetical protein